MELVILKVDVHIERQTRLGWNVDRGVDVRMVVVDLKLQVRKGSADTLHGLVKTFHLYLERHAA